MLRRVLIPDQPGVSLFPQHLPSPALKHEQQQELITSSQLKLNFPEFPCTHQGVIVELNRVQQPGQDPNPTGLRDKAPFYLFYPIPLPHFGLVKIRVYLLPQIIPESKPWINPGNVTAQGQDGAPSLISMGLLCY